MPASAPSRTAASASGSASKPMILTLSAMPARLDRLDRAQRHVVVGGDDHVGRRGHAGEQALGHRQALVAGEVRGLLGHELVLVLVLRRGRCAGPCCGRSPATAPGWPCRLMMLAPFGKFAITHSPWASPPLTLSAPTWAVIPSTPATRRSIVTTGTPLSIAVLHRRRHRVDVDRADDDAVHALHHRGLDVGGLLGCGVLAVRFDGLDAQRLTLVLHRLHHVDEEREIQARHRGHHRHVLRARLTAAERHQPRHRDAGQHRLPSISPFPTLPASASVSRLGRRRGRSLRRREPVNRFRGWSRSHRSAIPLAAREDGHGQDASSAGRSCGSPRSASAATCSAGPRTRRRRSACSTASSTPASTSSTPPTSTRSGSPAMPAANPRRSSASGCNGAAAATRW